MEIKRYKSIVSPIPKSGTKDPHTPLNYRGISLLSCLSKVYSSLLNIRILLYCNMSNILVDEQNGFRSARSCEEHIFSLTTLIRNQFTKSKPVFASFIDLQKAFDWVDRDLLMYRLLSYGINGKIYKAIHSLYNKTVSCVLLNQNVTDWFSVTSGVKQGDNLSPTLLCIYINDLAETLKRLNIGIKVNGKNICVFLYADDIVLLAENEKDLQTLLNTTHEWCSKWKLNINVEKSKIMHFRQHRKQQSNFQFKYGSTTLEYCPYYKYLGLYLDPNLNFNNGITTLADSGGRAFGAVIAKLKHLKDVRYKTFTTIFNSQIATILDYSSSIWSHKKAPECDVIQNKAMQYFLGVHGFTPVPALNGEMGWLPSRFRRYLNTIRLWNRLIKMDNNRLTKTIFLWDYEETQSSWCQNVKEIFGKLDFDNEYNLKQIVDIEKAKTNLFKLAEHE